MKVLIIGGTGSLGSQAARRFVQEGHRPIIFARHRDERLIFDIVDKVDIELGDILDWPSLMSVLVKHKVTHIVHTSAMVSSLCRANPSQGVQVNIVGTVNVLEAARILGIERVVYTSAKGVYGPFLGEHDYPTYKPVTESYRPTPSTRIYDITKATGDQICQYYREAVGVNTVVLRFASIFGPGRARYGDMAIHSLIVQEPFYGRPCHISKGGDAKDDFVYEKDVAYGIYLATIAEKAPSPVYNIGSGVAHSLRDIAEYVRKRIPGADVQIGAGTLYQSHPHAHAIYDISLAEKELGYKPQFTLERAVGDFLDTLQQMNEKSAVAKRG